MKRNHNLSTAVLGLARSLTVLFPFSNSLGRKIPLLGYITKNACSKILWLGAVLVLGIVWIGFAQVNGDVITVKGELVDLWCYLRDGSHGKDHKECGVACAKAGNPIGLVTETGDIYILMSSNDHQSGRDELADKIATQVAVKGRIYKHHNLNALYFSSLAPLEGGNAPPDRP